MSLGGQTHYPLELLRAELKSAMAEQMVTLMDRFISKADLAAFRSDFATHVREDAVHFSQINNKLDTLITEKLQRDGATNERTRFLGSRRWVMTTAIGFAVLLVTTISALDTYLWLTK